MPPRKRPNGRLRLPAAERRLQLIDAAQQAYQEFGIDGASVHKVANIAGINIATLYQHFASSSELLRAALLEPLEVALEEEIERVTPREGDLSRRQRLTQLHSGLQQIMQRLGLTVNVLMFSKNDDARRHFADVIWPRLIEWVEQSLTEAGEEESTWTSPALVGNYLWYAMHEAFRDQHSEPTEWAGRVADLVYGGIDARS